MYTLINPATTPSGMPFSLDEEGYGILPAYLKKYYQKVY